MRFHGRIFFIFSSRLSTQSKRKRDRLTKPSPELIDQILDEVYQSKKPPGGICKTLLPFHRCRIPTLTVRRGEEAHLEQLFPTLVNLRTLLCSPSPFLPALLSVLPSPSLLKKLHLSNENCYTGNYDFLGITSSFATSLSLLNNVEHLELDCPCELGSTEMHSALRQLPLKTLSIGIEAVDSVTCSDIVPLVSGNRRLARLVTLELDNVFAMEGDYAEDVEPWKSNNFEASWEEALPEWPDGFSRKELERLLKMSEVKIKGNTVDAMGIEDMYEEEKVEMEREARTWTKECQEKNARRRNEQIDYDDDSDEERGVCVVA